MGDTSAASSSSAAPLPPGWTSHTSPAGRTYYHNASSGVSTYTLPKPKREKPISKALIPNTAGWLKVMTNKENTFYFHPQTRMSQWLPPPHVAAALKQVEEQEARAQEQKKKEQEREQRKERERARIDRLERKRKLEEGVPITEFDASKRARADEEEEEEDIESDIGEKDDAVSLADHDSATPPALSEIAPDDAHNNDDDEEEWQRQIAEQLAAEAEAEAEAEAQNEPTTAASNPSQPSDAAPELNLEEAKTSFVAHLTSLNNTPSQINPMAPYDLEQPKFCSHPSFLALPFREREDVFNEWCKLRIREKRAAKAASSSSSSSSASKPSTAAASSADNFLSLLRSEVRSTRTKFLDFKSAFSRHPHFTAYGRSDSDRERLFKQHLIELGETKKRAAEKAEREFLDLLSDRLPGNLRSKVAAAEREGKEKVMDVWSTAKRPLVEDQRYDAVGSSTRRYELFCAWAKGERRQPKREQGSASSASASTDDIRAKSKQLKRQQALRDREAAVHAERQRLSRLNRSALSAASRQESVLSFQQLLLDAIASPLSYSEALPKLERDPRFEAGLDEREKRRLFDEHLARLRDKEDEKIGAIFAKYAVRLDTHRDDVLACTLDDASLSHPPLDTFAADPERLGAAYDRWDERRKRRAEHEFGEMLRESAFVEFWGRFRKAALSSSTSGKGRVEEAEQGQGRQEEEDAEQEGQTLVEMARKLDLHEIESVLSNDARFRAWRHVPEKRREWIREHLERLAAPANSVHK